MAEDDIVAEVKRFVSESQGHDSEERALMAADLAFVYDEKGQWDEETKRKRGNRPAYTFNRQIGAVNQVIGDQRQARPQIKVRPTDDKTDPELAEVQGGLIRNIENASDADSIYDMAFKYAVAGGYGCWRVIPEYSHPESFDQDLFIRPIHNPLTAFWDPLCNDPLKRGQNAFAVADRISRDVHEETYGKEMARSFEIPRDYGDWVTDKEVRVAEYFKRIPVKKEIALLSDGSVVDFDGDLKKIQAELESAAEEDETIRTVVRTRKTTSYKVKWWKVDGAQILEGPITYDWTYIPAVKLPGRFINIEGREKTQSLVRHAKDPQRMYNYDRTTMSEVVGNAPRAPYLMTPKMIKGFEDQWKTANATNRPFLLFNPDDTLPGGNLVPQRAAPPDVPNALVALAALDSDDIKATTGIFDASLGEQGPQESGEAIRARQTEGDVGSYEFIDNLGKALKFTGEILVDMIPKVYDTERTVRILGLDGQEDFVTINAYDEKRERDMNIGEGRYDVSVTIGPAYSTQRREALSQLLDAAGVMPVIAEVAPDLILQNLDVPGADELVKRLRKPLIATGAVEPNEDEEAPPPPEPDPVTQALVAESDAKAKAQLAKAGKDLSETEKNQAELRQMMEELIGTKLDNMFKNEEVKAIRAGSGEMRIIVND